ncbi:MAG: RICIN domain-containing protein [Trebonia sp.]
MSLPSGPPSRRRPRGSLVRAALALVAVAAVLATLALQPLAASAQTLPKPPIGSRSMLSSPPKSKPGPWSAATARPTLRPPKTVNAAALRQQAIAQAAKTEKIGSYRVSPAVLAFLDKGLGMRLGSTTVFTGVRSGAALKISLPAPAGLRLGLPAGAPEPSFSRSTVSIDPATGALTLTANSGEGALRVAIANAASRTLASGAGLSSQMTLRVPVLGATVSLSGQISYPSGAAGTASVSLSGDLPAGAVLQSNVVRLAAGTAVTLSTAGGLRVSGPAILGRPGRQLSVTLSGAVSGEDSGTFTVSPGVPSMTLPGLALSDANGTVTATRGIVRFDVHARTARPWTPVPGVSVVGSVEFANMIPNDRLVPAPGITGTTLWLDIAGAISVPSGVTVQGAVAVNLATGKGLLTGGSASAVTLATTPDRLVLDQAGFRGALTVGTGRQGISGSVRGTGRVTLTGAGKRVTTDTALTVTSAGRLVASFPADRSVLGLGAAGREDTAYWASAAVSGFPGARTSLPAGLSAAAAGGATAERSVVHRTAATSRSVSKKTATAADGTASYTLSGAVYNFLTGTLNIPLGSATLTGTLSGQTLTATVKAPTALPSSLPGWIPNPAYVNTQIKVDEATGTLTLTAATSGGTGMTAMLSITIANVSTSPLADGIGVTGSLALGNVPFAGDSTAQLTFGLGYTGSALSVSLSGSLTSDAKFAGGTVTLPANEVTVGLASGTGLTVQGTADINAGGSTAAVSVNGTLKDLSDWSLTVSDASAPLWQPATGLSVTPDFAGSISDTAGTIGFDLTSSGPGPAATWIAPDESTLSVGSLEVSNRAPSGAAACSASDVTAGDVWIGVKDATFSYTPASLSLGASGCFDLTGGSATVTTAATGDLTSEFGSGLPFTVSAGGLTATVAGSGKYSLTGTATVTVTQGGVSGDPEFTGGLQLSSAGLVAGIQVPDLSSVGFSGSGALYVASTAMPGFDPATLGLTGQPASVSLPAGLAVSLSYTLPGTVSSDLADVIPGFPQGSSVQAMASLSGTGFTVGLSLALGTGTGTGGLEVINSNGTALYLDELNLAVVVGDQVQVTMSGTGYLELPALVNHVTDPAAATVTVAGSLTVGSAISLTLSVDFKDWSKNEVLGIPGLSAEDFGGSMGLTYDPGAPAPVPSLGLYAKNVMLPASWENAIGMVPGSQISFNAQLNLNYPVLAFSVTGPPALPGQPEQPALKPLGADPNAKPSVVNSLTVNTADFDLAPFGGTDPRTGDPITSGVAVIFDATVDYVGVHVDANVSLSTLSVSADASADPFPVGPVQVTAAMFHLMVTPTSFSFSISGGISYGGSSFTASINLSVGTNMAGASVTLSATSGDLSVPFAQYLSGSLTLTGSVDASGGSISASGSAKLTAKGSTLGPVSFSFSLPGPLSWSDLSDSITQIASFFKNAGASASQVAQYLESFGYSLYDTINALSDIDDWGPQVVNGLASAFGFSTTYYDIWTYTFPGVPLVLDVQNGSQSPNASVITWLVNGGYNQDWEFVQSPYTGYYEIMNRGSGQCLSVGNDSTAAGQGLVQYPCYGLTDQLWYMGNIAQGTDYNIRSALDSQVVDVQNAYPYAGGYVDQWPSNGGSNQTFWLTSSTN